jgi:Protein of unknown function (DUF669)
MSDDLPETFDPSAHKGTGFECIPVGWYPAQIIETDVRHANNGNGTYLLATFEITEGDYHGRKIFQNITLQNDNQQAVEIGARLLKDIYEAVGHAGPTRSTDILLYKPVMARVGIKRDKDGVYDDKNCISKVKGPDYQPKGASGPSKASPVPPKGPVTPPTSAGPGSSGGGAPWR